MNIQIFPSGPIETNAYVVSCPKMRQAAIIDPAPNSTHAIKEYISKEQLQPIVILLTHSHWDHTADVAPLKKHYKVPAWIHSFDAPNLETPGIDGLPCWLEIEGVTPEKLIKDGDSFNIGDLHFLVIHTPGHTPGGVCFYCPAENVLFSGDTLFQGTIGNISFPTARPELMWKSLDILSKLPPTTRVFPGHGSSTTIGAERWLPKAREYFGS